jgi:hypothetical protein
MQPPAAETQGSNSAPGLALDNEVIMRDLWPDYEEGSDEIQQEEVVMASLRFEKFFDLAKSRLQRR